MGQDHGGGGSHSHWNREPRNQHPEEQREQSIEHAQDPIQDHNIASAEAKNYMNNTMQNILDEGRAIQGVEFGEQEASRDQNVWGFSSTTGVVGLAIYRQVAKTL